MSKTNTNSTSIIGTSGSAKALSKGLALVDILASSGRPMRQVDLIEASGLPRPSVIRILDALCKMDVLRQSAGVYELGPRLAAWGQAFLDRLELPRQATDIMEGLVELSGETCFLGVRDRSSVLYVAAVNSPQPVRPAARVGFHNPLYTTGIGKVLLAALSPEEREPLLHYPLEARTPNTITDPDVLAAELDAVLTRGYSIDDIENEEGVRCVAAPVFDHTGATVAAISVSAPAYRFTIEDVARLAPDVLVATAELSARIGHRPSEDWSSPDLTDIYEVGHDPREDVQHGK